MPATDTYHQVVKNALTKDGWIITHDPYTLAFGQRNVFVDLGAERVLAAEKGQEKIAIEIFSLSLRSEDRANARTRRERATFFVALDPSKSKSRI
jgi:hypothetical protein